MGQDSKLASSKIMNGIIKLLLLLAVEVIVIGGVAFYMSVTNNPAPSDRPLPLALLGSITAVIFNILFDIARDNIIANHERRIEHLENDVQKIDNELAVLKRRILPEG